MTASLYVETAKRVEYDPETGIMIWKYDPSMSKRWNSMHAGKRAGSIGHAGRCIGITVAGADHKLLTRRLAYLISYGELPEFVGTKDGDNTNDSKLNLTEISILAIGRKRKKMSNNTSGHVGVYFDKLANKWRASVYVNGSNKGNSKSFDNEIAAELWVKQKRIELGFDSDLHGRD